MMLRRNRVRRKDNGRCVGQIIVRGFGQAPAHEIVHLGRVTVAAATAQQIADDGVAVQVQAVFYLPFRCLQFSQHGFAAAAQVGAYAFARSQLLGMGQRIFHLILLPDRKLRIFCVLPKILNFCRQLIAADTHSAARHQFGITIRGHGGRRWETRSCPPP